MFIAAMICLTAVVILLLPLKMMSPMPVIVLILMGVLFITGIVLLCISTKRSRHMRSRAANRGVVTVCFAFLAIAVIVNAVLLLTGHMTWWELLNALL